MKRLSKFSQSGSVFVEAAIVTPVFMTLFVATIQFGQIYGVMSNLRGASAVAARAAVLGTGQTNTQVCAAALNAIPDTLNSAQVSCATEPSVLPAAWGAPVTVTLTYPVTLLSTSSGILGGPTMTLSAHTTMQ